MKTKLFTSESVTEGHPDKLADQISDAILDAFLEKDPKSRVAVEVLLTSGLCLIAGEITSKAMIDLREVAKGVIKKVGYTNADFGFCDNQSGIIISVNKQSPDIAQGVSKGKEDFKKVGAGDQGLMFGYATSETKELMPLPIILAHKITRKLAKVRKGKQIKGLRPDGKAQVTVEYDESGSPVRIKTILISAQHGPDKKIKDLKKELIEKVIKKAVPKKLINSRTKFLVNPTGRFVIGGPNGDTGLTGRKIIVDTYGGMARHGGGCFSGKDPTKVDRSATYAARWVAKNIVAAGLAKRCEVQISYAIGMAEPISVRVDTFGTAKVSEDRLEKAIKKIFDLRPGMIIKNLNLRKPIYQQVAAYGHFGRDDLDLPWEKLNKVKELKKIFK